MGAFGAGQSRVHGQRRAGRYAAGARTSPFRPATVRFERWDSNPRRSVLIDLRTGGSQERHFHGAPEDILDPPPLFPTWNVLRVINAIAALPGEGLAICGRKDQWRKIILNQHGRLEILNCPRVYSGVLPFSIHPVPARLGCSLQVAKWPGGSAAWLDSRGLLHLKSRDPKIPEISLMLSDGEVAAWTSDGLVSGPRFFLGETAPTDPTKIFERLKQFLSLL
jgi:MoxR-vWA-beta-propeller ternary system domain bpX1